MLYRLPCILCLLILIIVGFFTSSGDVSKPETSKALVVDSHGNDLKGLSEFQPRKRNLLSLPSKQDTVLIAALDGTMYLVESDSKRVIWSFSTGSPIYSSYQAPLNNDSDQEHVHGPSIGFMECGDDWNLYVQKNPFVKMRLSTSVADFVKATPIILDDGAVTLGSKKTTLFDVDAKTGRLVRSYAISEVDNVSAWWSDDRQNAANIFGKQNQGLVETDPVKLNTPELLLKIFRTDYSLQSVSPKSDKILWSMTVAEFDAVLFCRGNENPSDGASFNLEGEYISDVGLDFAMPYPCRERKEVHRLRKNLLLESPIPERLPADYHEKEMLPMPAINPMLPSQPNVDGLLTFDDENRMLPSQPTVDGRSFGHDESRMLPAPQQPEVSFNDNNDYAVALPQPPAEINASGKVDRNRMAEWSVAFPLILFMVFLLGIYLVRDQSTFKGQNESDLKNTPPKKKKMRKSGKNGNSVSKKDKHLSSDDEDIMTHTITDREEWLNLNKVDEVADGRKIGKLCVSNKEIAKGSNGTVVLEGMYEGRSVAVKRLVRVHHDVASKEIQNLIASDHHPNIVRWYGVEYDLDFIYLALERCSCSLDDLIQIYSDIFENPVFSKDQTSRSMIKAQMDIGKDNMQGLWKTNGYPSPLLLKLMRDMVAGLAHLHELGIIHRDLKPQNVLIIKERSLRAKLSDMGISKRLLGDMSSLGHNATGCGSSGWQAPEQLAQGRQTRAVDLFSLGCVLFFCITSGRHPFGERLERDVNIVRNQKDLFLIEFIPEAKDLISRLLDPNPDQRPKALEVLHHPFFWDSEMRLSFLRDVSDRVELEDRESNSDLLKALEGSAPVALGGKWDEKLESAFITNIGRYRRYKFGSVRDLLRVMRNKLNHYRELPLDIQELLGSLPDGFNDYFAARFPRLLIEVYKILFQHCKEEECFQRYFKNVD